MRAGDITAARTSRTRPAASRSSRCSSSSATSSARFGRREPRLGPGPARLGPHDDGELARLAGAPTDPVRADWRDLGVARVRATSLFGRSNVTVWVAQFGHRVTPSTAAVSRRQEPGGLDSTARFLRRSSRRNRGERLLRLGENGREGNLKVSRTTRLRRRRSTIALASLVLVGLLSFVAIGVASGASTGLTAAQEQPSTGVDVRRREVCERERREDGSLAARADGLEARAGDDQVRVHSDGSYAGGIKGLKATSPRVTHKSLAEEHPRRSSATSASRRRRSSGSTARHQARGARARRSASCSRSRTAASPPACRRTRSRKLLSQPGVVAVQKDTLNQPLDDNTSFIGATNVWPTLGGQDNAGSNVVVGVIDTGVWPEHPMLRRHGISAPPHGCRSTTASSVTARTSRISARRSRATTS